MASLPAPKKAKMFGSLPRPASRKENTPEAAAAPSASEPEKADMQRRKSLKASNSISDILGTIARPTFFRRTSSKMGMSTKRNANKLGIDSVLRSEDGVAAVREFCRSFPGQRKYLEFWLEVGGIGGYKDKWNKLSDGERTTEAERIAAKYLRAGAQHFLNEGGIQPMPDPLPDAPASQQLRASRVTYLQEGNSASMKSSTITTITSTTSRKISVFCIFGWCR